MKIASMFAATAIAAAMSTSAFASTGGDLGSLPPSASFSNTVAGAFTDVWTFNLDAPSVVAASLTNVEVSFNGGSGFGGIQGFSAWLNGVALFGPTSNVSSDNITVRTQVLAGGTQLVPGMYELKVSGTGVSGGSASYGGNIVAAPVPEPESYAMLLAGLGVMGTIAMRRNKSKKQD